MKKKHSEFTTDAGTAVTPASGTGCCRVLLVKPGSESADPISLLFLPSKSQFLTRTLELLPATRRSSRRQANVTEMNRNTWAFDA
ncbi:hypothetical protein RRG08_040986 [Elysia crispata]|uniref:Uncharacterized protein n=1 Tax=Elysia crispata TaxID=231223 RepID=A0AAE0ZII7_9GAST|nr:hypothetical protein RRG08_040986 [Elysia crispata]